MWLSVNPWWKTSSSARTTFLVVSAIFVALHCVHCAPSSEVSENSERTARYIQTAKSEAEPVAKSAHTSSQVKQMNGNYNNNGGNAYVNNGGNNEGNYGNPVVSYTPYDPPYINSNNTINMISEDAVPSNNNEVGVSPSPPPQNAGFGAVVSSFWDMMLNFIRVSMGIQRRDPPRIARTLLGAAAGKDECWKTSACHAGRMMRSLADKEVVFMLAEMISPDDWKPLVRGMRRAAVQNEDCRIYECNV